ncbi:hypothetical protein Taro_044951 [Colocasia esculenta]|uniref:Uncharacterized protein n=1 Tax=Colocasia esculenta TaxID=4460 RepID=A0A843X605_COLES|nr:hypothetical protein [Colocasia esculenta]
MASSGSSSSVGGYRAEFLTAEQQVRFAIVKIKLCGHKVVDMKNGMGSIVEALDRLKWSKMDTISEVSFPDLVKAFYVCLKTEEDGTLTSMVKGTPIRVTHDLLASLFGVGTSGHSGVHTVNVQEKGLGIVGPEFRLKMTRLIHEAAGAVPAIPDVEEIQAAVEPEVAAAPSVEAELAAAAALSSNRIEDIPPEDIEPVGHSLEDTPPSSRVASILRDVLDSIQSTQEESEIGGDSAAETVAPGHTEEIIEEEAPIQGEQEIIIKGDQMEDAPAQGEQSSEKDRAPQGEHNENIYINDQFSEEHVDFVEPIAKASTKGKRVAHRRSKKKQQKVSLKPVIKRLVEQGKAISSMKSDIQSISISQTSVSNEFGTLSTEVHNLRDDFKMFKQLCRWMKGEFDSVKKLISSREQSTSAPPDLSHAEPVSNAGPSGPRSAEENAEASSEPSGPRNDENIIPAAESCGVEKLGPSGPSEDVVRPPGSLISEGVDPRIVESAVAPEAHESSSLATPDPPSPPSSSTAPPAPPIFKQPAPRTISSPAPFPSEPYLSPIIPSTISTSISLVPLVVIDPPVSSSAGASSSSDPSSVGPSTNLSPKSFLYPPIPPTSVTITPTDPRLASVFQNKFEDDLERTTLISILAVASHVHRTDSSCPVSKKRKISKTLALSSEPLFPPLWYSLTVENRRRPIYCEYLQKCVLASLFGIPFLNLTDHLNIILPYCHLSKADQHKIFQLAECKTEDQWVKGHKTLYSKYLLARSDSTSRQDHPLTLSEWFTIHHQALWGPFILKEIRITRCFQLYNDFQYLHKLPEVQFGQFHGALAILRTESPINCPFLVDFTTLQIPEVVFLPKLHSLVLDSSIGSHAFERFARVMGRILAKQGRLPSFQRFIFREYHLGHISSAVLAPLMSECERLSPTDWERYYNQSALQLESLNSSLVRAGKPPLSAEAFLDLNSINPVQELFVQWAAQYSAFISLKKDLKDHQFFYHVTIAHFLQRSSFGKSSHFRFTLDKNQHAHFLEDQRQLYIEHMRPEMGASFSIESGIFQQLFEEQEIKACELISRHASLLSPNFYLPVPPQSS